LQIVQTNILTGLEEVAYLKTFWLKLVQRRWKKIYKARQELLKQRMTIRALTFRARTGKWPRQSNSTAEQFHSNSACGRY
jgi:hypothetical protein